MQKNIVSISGGKDSTATLLVAIEQDAPNIMPVFADTGHEHQATYDYIDYLESALSLPIKRVKADFSDKVIAKRDLVLGKWVDDGAVTVEQANVIAGLLVPTGNPFLDLCLWKGRFPSTRARFCSEFLKHHPLDMYMLGESKGCDVISWQGVRADESPSRANLPETEQGDFYTIYRPILKWKAEDTFGIAARHGLKPNPLYKQGMGRVGCMPCIHANKSELREIAKRFPDEVERVAEWERLVSATCKHGVSTFFHASTDPTIATKDNAKISAKTHGIHRITDWANTARGGRQRDLIDMIDASNVSQCTSQYGLCE